MQCGLGWSGGLIRLERAMVGWGEDVKFGLRKVGRLIGFRRLCVVCATTRNCCICNKFIQIHAPGQSWLTPPITPVNSGIWRYIILKITKNSIENQISQHPRTRFTFTHYVRPHFAYHLPTPHTLPHFPTHHFSLFTTLNYYHTNTLSYHYTITLLHYYIITLPRYHYTTLSHYPFISLSPYHFTQLNSLHPVPSTSLYYIKPLTRYHVNTLTLYRIKVLSC